MTPLHALNLAVHIGAGTVALLLGAVLLLQRKGTRRHRRWGRVFGVLACVVCGSAAASLAFGYQPLFAVLTLTVAYQVWGGWRAVRWRGQGPDWRDAAATVLAAIGAVALMFGTRSWNAPVAGALGWLAMVLVYDGVRWGFPRRWFDTLWQYEHAGKWIACVAGMASAMLGNVWRSGQPWSQLLPSVGGVVLITWTCFGLRRRAARTGRWQDRRFTQDLPT